MGERSAVKRGVFAAVFARSICGVRLLRCASLGFAGLWCVAAFSNASPSPATAISGRAMGTVWSVKYVQPALHLHLDSAMVSKQVAEKLEQLENIFSTYRADSELSQFNAATHTDWVVVAPEMVRVAEESRRISELTNGAFDVTIDPLVRLWGFGAQRRSGSVPTASEIAGTRKLVDWRQLESRAVPPALRKARPGVSTDFSSMAKGFAAEAVSETLMLLGVSNYLAQVGGDVQSAGAGPDGRGWPVAIEQLVGEAQAIAGIASLNGQALSTSGDYRNFFMSGGRRYGHIIDPRTGEPPTHSLAAVSVIHSSCATSSALATALFVLGSEEGFRTAVEHKLACLFIIRSDTGLVHRSTPQFRARLRDGVASEPSVNDAR
jgi:thiamine biosynthesis lipoprotein